MLKEVCYVMVIVFFVLLFLGVIQLTFDFDPLVDILASFGMYDKYDTNITTNFTEGSELLYNDTIDNVSLELNDSGT